MEIFQNYILISQVCLGYEQFCGPSNYWLQFFFKKRLSSMEYLLLLCKSI